MNGFDYVTVPEFASMTQRSRQAVLKMVKNGTLREMGYKVRPIKPKRESSRMVKQWAIGVPVERKDAQ